MNSRATPLSPCWGRFPSIVDAIPEAPDLHNGYKKMSFFLDEYNPHSSDILRLSISVLPLPLYPLVVHFGSDSGNPLHNGSPELGDRIPVRQWQATNLIQGVSRPGTDQNGEGGALPGPARNNISSFKPQR
jgi:hypothetical protein